MAEATVVIKYTSDVTDAKAAYDDLVKYAKPIQIKYTGAASGSSATQTATFAGGGIMPPEGGIPGVAAATDVLNGRLNRLPVIENRVRQTASSRPPDDWLFNNAQREDARRLRYDIYQRRADEAGLIGPRLSDAQYDSPQGQIQAREDFRQNRVAANAEAAEARAQAQASRFAERQQIRQLRQEARQSRLDDTADANRVRYNIYQRRADEEGLVGPRLSESQYQTSAGRLQAAEDFRLNRLASRNDGGSQSRSNPFTRGSLARYLGIFEATRATESLFQSQTDYAIGLANAAGDPMAYAQAQINDPTRRFVSGIPLLGGVASSIADYATGSSVYVATTLRASQLQDSVTQSTAQRYALQRQAAQGLAVSRAALNGPAAAQIQNLNNQLGDISDGVARQAYVDQNSVAARTALIAAGQQRNAASGAGFFSQVGSFLTSGSTEGAQIAQQSSKEYQAVQSAYQSAQTQLTKVQQDAQKFTDTQKATIEAQLDLIKQGASDSATLAFGGAGLALGANNLAKSGDPFGASAANVRARFNPQIAAAQLQLLRTVQSSPADAGLIGAATSQVTGLIAQSQIESDAAAANTARARIGFQGGIASSLAGLAFNPYGARRAEAQARYDQALIVPGGGVAPVGSEQRNMAASQLAIENRQINQQERLDRLSISNSLNAQAAQNAALLNRNPIGAQIAGLVGSATNQIQRLGQSGFSDLAEQARQNALGQIDVTEQQFYDNLSARQVDPFEFAVSPRDRGSFDQVLSSFSKGRTALGAINPTEGVDNGSGSNDVVGLFKQVADILVNAIRNGQTTPQAGKPTDPSDGSQANDDWM